MIMNYDSPSIDRLKILDTYGEARVLYDPESFAYKIFKTLQKTSKPATFNRRSPEEGFTKLTHEGEQNLALHYALLEKLVHRLTHLSFDYESVELRELVLSLFDSNDQLHAFAGIVDENNLVRLEVSNPAKDLNMELIVSNDYPGPEHLFILGTEHEGYLSFLRVPAEFASEEVRNLAPFISYCHQVEPVYGEQFDIAVKKSLVGVRDIVDLHIATNYDRASDSYIYAHRTLPKEVD